MGSSVVKPYQTVVPVDICRETRPNLTVTERVDRLAQFGSQVMLSPNGHHGYRGLIILIGATFHNVDKYVTSLAQTTLNKKTGYFIYVKDIKCGDLSAAFESLLSSLTNHGVNLDYVDLDTEFAFRETDTKRKCVLYLLLESFSQVFNINRSPADSPCQRVEFIPIVYEGLRYHGHVMCRGALTERQMETLSQYFTDGGRPMRYRAIIANDFKVFLKIFVRVEESRIHHVVVEKTLMPEEEEEEEEEDRVERVEIHQEDEVEDSVDNMLAELDAA